VRNIKENSQDDYMKSEAERLDDASHSYDSDLGVLDGKLINHYTTQMILPRIVESDRVLMLGLGNGHVADIVTGHCESLVVIEGSEKLVSSAVKAGANYEVEHAFFEEYEAAQPFDVVIGTHVLEHVVEPSIVLKRSRTWLSDDGIAIFTVPNRNSLHRRIGTKMGLLDHEASLNESDVKLGHLRVYDSDSLLQDLTSGGFHDISIDGYWLKMVPNRVIATWDRDLLDAIYAVSNELSADICADLIAICRK
jgi:SAM-dependent methyltransferase